MNFKGSAKRLDDIDLPKIAQRIGCGEDHLHAIIEVETAGGGFDKEGRPRILFEPHIFFRLLSGAQRQAAVNKGLAYAKWGAKPYPKDSYPRLILAMQINPTAALKACSWGLGQIMGENHVAAGYDTVQEMVEAFAADEENHLNAMVSFIIANHLDDEIRAHNWAAFARGYNGPGYKKNAYDTKLAAAFAKWRKIKDTPYNPELEQPAVKEPVQPVATPEPEQPAVLPVSEKPQEPVQPAPPPPDIEPVDPVKPAAPGGFFVALWEAFSRLRSRSA